MLLYSTMPKLVHRGVTTGQEEVSVEVVDPVKGDVEGWTHIEAQVVEDVLGETDLTVGLAILMIVHLLVALVVIEIETAVEGGNCAIVQVCNCLSKL